MIIRRGPCHIMVNGLKLEVDALEFEAEPTPFVQAEIERTRQAWSRLRETPGIVDSTAHTLEDEHKES